MKKKIVLTLGLEPAKDDIRVSDSPYCARLLVTIVVLKYVYYIQLTDYVPYRNIMPWIVWFRF